MNMSELRSTILESSLNDWKRVPVQGPTYRDRFVPWLSPADKTSGIEVHSHSDVAVFEPDIDLTMAFGMRAPGAVENPSFKWAKFPDPEITTHIADIFWRGALVDRVDYISVDGHRCNLPIGGGHQGLRITKYDYTIARILDYLEGGDRFDQYYNDVPYEYVG